MWRVTLKGLLGHKLRFMLTGLAVLLGVAFMAGTLVLTDTIQVIFDDLVASVNDGTDAFVRSNEVVDSAFGEERNRVSADLLPQVRAVQGVAQAEGDLQFYAQVVDAKGEAIGNPGRGAPSFGFIWNPGRLNAYRLVAGNSPSAAGEVVIDRGTAKKGNLRVGSKVKVLSQSAPQDFKVAGIVTFGEADSPAGASVSLFTSEEAQRLSGAVGQYDGISVSAVDGVSQEEMVRRIDSALSDPKVEVITGATLTKENQDQFTQQLSFFSTALLAFALISLFVGSFIIFNTFSIIVAQRTREIGLMRAIGASRSQIVKSVIAEAALVGILASAVGLGIGILLAAGLKALLAGLGIDIPAGATQVLPRTIILCLGVGTFVTIAASVLPSRKASRISPMQALRSTGSDPMKQLGRRSTIGVVITAVGIGSLLYGLFGNVGNPTLFVGIGALVVFLGVAALGPVIARPVSRVLAAPLPKLKGMVGVLARENAVRNPRRTASTAAALMIGVALVGFITIFAASIKNSIATAVDSAFTADFVVAAKGGGPPSLSGFSPDLAQKIKEVPGVGASSGLRFAGAELQGKGVFVIASDPATSTQLFDVKPESGDFKQLGINDVAVSSDRMKKEGWVLGQRISAKFPKGASTLKISAVFGMGQQAGLSDYFISLAGYDAHYTQQLDSQVYAKVADDANPRVVGREIKKILKEYPTAELLDQEQFKATRSGQVDQILNLIYALLALAVVIALIGIANTLGLSIVERTNELGLLRAVGMTRRQLRSAIRWESVIIALLGTALGLVIAVFFGWALVTALRDQGLSGFVAPIDRLAVIVVLAGFAGVLAAILPARRAARLNVLDAISQE